MRLFVWRKGGPESGWHAPPRGTHTGEKHRAVGSGKAGTASAIDPKLKPAIVDTVDELKVSDPRGFGATTGYFIRADGKLVDIIAVSNILFPEYSEPQTEHSWVLSNHPELLGLSGEQARQASTSFGAVDYGVLNEWGIVRVFSTPKVVAIDGISLDRRGIDTIQKYVLVDKKLPVNKTAEYVWNPSGGVVGVSATYDELMMAKYPRDLKDMVDGYPKILIRLLVPA